MMRVGLGGKHDADVAAAGVLMRHGWGSNDTSVGDFVAILWLK